MLTNLQRNSQKVTKYSVNLEDVIFTFETSSLVVDDNRRRKVIPIQSYLSRRIQLDSPIVTNCTHTIILISRYYQIVTEEQFLCIWSRNPYSVCSWKIPGFRLLRWFSSCEVTFRITLLTHDLDWTPKIIDREAYQIYHLQPVPTCSAPEVFKEGFIEKTHRMVQKWIRRCNN